MTSKLRYPGLVVSAVVITALVVSACGGGDPTPAPTARPQTQQPTATAAPTATLETAATAEPAPGRPTARPAATPTPAPTAMATGPQPVRGGTFNFWMTRNPSNMDLNRQRSSANWMSVLPQMNWLVQNYQGRQGPGPDLAESWTVSDDGKIWTFKLVQNAKWHDGEAVNADDVIWTFTRITRNPDEQGVEGAGPVKVPPYLGALALITSMEKPDDFTVVINLSKVTAAFLPIIGAIGNVIYPQHVPITEFEQKRPVGSGPFVWAGSKVDDSVELTANPNYFKKDAAGGQLPYMDAMKIFVISDASLGLSAFRTGKIDMTFPFATVITVSMEATLREQHPGTGFFTGGLGWAYLEFAAGKAPWDNNDVRRAFSLAIDRVAFSEAATEGRGSPFVFFSPVGSNWGLPEGEMRSLPGYNPDTKDADIAEARRLIAAAGLTADDLKVSVPVRDIYETLAVVAIQNLNENLGTDLKINLMDNATTIKVQNDAAFDIYISRNSGGLDDPSALLTPFVRTGANLNYGNWSDPEVDAAIDAIDAELDVIKRLQMTNDLERKLIDLAWYVILSSTPSTIAWSARVENFDMLHGQDGPPWRFEDIWLKN